MKRLFALLLTTAIAITACGETVPTLSEPDDPGVPTETTTTSGREDPAPTTTAPVTKPPEPIIIEKGDWKWVVEPKFDYSGLAYCSSCNVFVIGSIEGGAIVDETTGLMRVGAKGAHSYGVNTWVYDENLDLLGKSPSWVGESLELYKREEFHERFPEVGQRIKVVYRIDSTMITDDGHGGDDLPQEAYSGVGVAYGTEFITDFTYKARHNGRHASSYVLTVVENNNGKVGAIGNDGKVWIEFDFEEILIIDAWTAFAKRDGLWGIIAFNGTVPKNRPNPNYTSDEIALFPTKTAKIGKFSGVIGLATYSEDPDYANSNYLKIWWEVAEAAAEYLTKDKSVTAISSIMVYNAYEPRNGNYGFGGVWLMVEHDNSIMRLVELHFIKDSPGSDWVGSVREPY